MTVKQKEKIIAQYMKSLCIGRAEAEQLFEDDENDFITEEGEAFQEKAKQSKSPYAPSEKRQKRKGL